RVPAPPLSPLYTISLNTYEYSDLRDSDLQGVRCWFCREQIEGKAYAETTVATDGMLMWVPLCDNCDPPPPPPEPPTPIAAWLACPICNETLAPPRRHSCGEAAHWGVAGGAGFAGAAATTFTTIAAQSI
ncbi:MAG: hypothetical protein IVW55_13600, partial [Chloroflexi bacterium]|nr:hypothetical protein [Chloroflexota bacterium]